MGKTNATKKTCLELRPDTIGVAAIARKSWRLLASSKLSMWNKQQADCKSWSVPCSRIDRPCTVWHRHHPCFSQGTKQMNTSLMVHPQFAFGNFASIWSNQPSMQAGQCSSSPKWWLGGIQLLRSTSSILIANLNVQLKRMDQSPQLLHSSNVQHHFSLEKARRV